MANNVRYTAAKRREVEAARIAWLEARDRAWAAMTLDEYLDAAREIDLSTGQEFIDFHTRQHAALVAKYAA